EKNLGYTGGNNRGIAAARGRYIALINDDTRADSRWLEEMAAVMEAAPGCGMVAGKILSYFDPGTIDNVGHIICRDGTFRGRGRLEKDRGQYDRVEEILSPSGCAMMVRIEALRQCGGFDEDFFIYGDDAELSLRIRLGGWKTYYAPGAVVLHKYSASTGAYSREKAFLVERNRIWLTVKYFPLPALAAAPFFSLGRMALQAYGVVAGRGASGEFVRQYSAGLLLLILVRAHLAALGGIPKMWKKRRRLRRERKVPVSEFYRWLREYGLSLRELALTK
ncbi:MAG TPA: glycosyltransferase family 2 protein, partial [bacterium]|nr:glycosyltransferase family 2 protein [bacterium]